jgi:hypothetical protein
VEDVVFQPTRVQQRHRGAARGAVACGALTLAFVAVAVVAHGYAWVAALVFLAGFLVFVSTMVLTAGDHTRCTADGIAARIRGRRRTWRWPEIDDIVVTTASRRGAPRSVVVVVPGAGRRVRLAAPIDGGSSRDPDFTAKVEQLRSYWVAHR